METAEDKAVTLITNDFASPNLCGYAGGIGSVLSANPNKLQPISGSSGKPWANVAFRECW